MSPLQAGLRADQRRLSPLTAQLVALTDRLLPQLPVPDEQPFERPCAKDPNPTLLHNDREISKKPGNPFPPRQELWPLTLMIAFNENLLPLYYLIVKQSGNAPNIIIGIRHAENFLLAWAQVLRDHQKKYTISEEESWFDEGDRCSPGPGAHSPAIPYATNPPQWGTSRDRERDSFLEKYHRQYPPPDRYKVTELNKTHVPPSLCRPRPLHTLSLYTNPKRIPTK